MVCRFAAFSLMALFSLCATVWPVQTSAMPRQAAQDAKVLTGTVIETMNSAGYTYMLVTAGSSQEWIAIPEASVTVGSQVGYYEGMVMANFTSKSLGKTFARILFSAGLATSEAAGASPPPPQPPGSDDSFSAALQAEQNSMAPIEPASQTSGGSSGAIAPLQEISVAKATGENGHTVGEIFEKAGELSSKKVRIQGKVVKISPNIMGKNWVHLQDGTGNPLKNTHDLVVTTDASLAVDTVVTLEGILATDKDFGAGYSYRAIVEQAMVVQ